MTFSSEPDDLARLALLLLAGGTIVMAAENMALRRYFGRDQLFDARFSFKFAVGHSIRPVADTLFSPAAFVAVSGFAALAGIVALGAPGELAFALACVFCTFYLYSQVARPYGTCGADQMANILSVLLVLYFLPGAAQPTKHLVTAFAAVQIALAYLTTGMAKLSSAEWRSGCGLRGVMNSYVYGRNVLSRLFNRQPGLYFWMSWFIIVSQILTGVGILAGGTALSLALVCGGIFHLAVAVLMRLNLFPWMFIGMYPLAMAFHAGGGYAALSEGFAKLS